MVRFPKHKHLTPIMDHKEPCGWLREAVGGGGLLAWLKLHIFRKWDATLRMSTEYTQAFISSVSLQIQIVCRPKIASHPPFFNLFYIKTQFCYPQMQLFYVDPLKAQKYIMVCVHIFLSTDCCISLSSSKTLYFYLLFQTGLATALSVTEDLIFCGCADGTVRAFNPVNLHFICTLPRPHSLGTDIATVTDARSAATFKNLFKFTLLGPCELWNLNYIWIQHIHVEIVHQSICFA